LALSECASSTRISRVNTPIAGTSVALVGSGIYLGVVSAAIVVGFGLTIVVRRVATPYVVVEADDDV